MRVWVVIDVDDDERSEITGMYSTRLLAEAALAVQAPLRPPWRRVYNLKIEEHDVTEES